MDNVENQTDFEDIVDNVDENEVIEENTIAAETLKTHSSADKTNASGDEKAVTSSKVSMMQNMAHLMAGMDKVDLVDFYHKVIDQFGPGKSHGVGDNSAKNSSTIDTTLGKGPKTKDSMPHLDHKNNALANIGKVAYEDVEEMFSGSELSEDFKEKASTIFEAAIGARLTTEIARLEEEYETKLEEHVAVVTEELSAKLDTYLDYVVENWMKENEVAIESTLRNEIMEEFIDGLKNLFAENYINVPEDKIDVLESLANKVETLEAKLDEAISMNSELEEIIVEEARKDILENLSSDLALTQQEKFAALVEGIEFDGDLDTYSKKLKIVKENYFKSTTTHSSNINEEVFEGEVTDNVVNVDPEINRYVQAIARTTKK